MSVWWILLMMEACMSGNRTPMNTMSMKQRFSRLFCVYSDAGLLTSWRQLDRNHAILVIQLIPTKYLKPFIPLFTFRMKPGLELVLCWLCKISCLAQIQTSLLAVWWLLTKLMCPLVPVSGATFPCLTKWLLQTRNRATAACARPSFAHWLYNSHLMRGYISIFS